MDSGAAGRTAGDGEPATAHGVRPADGTVDDVSDARTVSWPLAKSKAEINKAVDILSRSAAEIDTQCEFLSKAGLRIADRHASTVTNSTRALLTELRRNGYIDNDKF